MSCFLSTLYVPHQLFTGSPGYQPALTNPPYVVSGIHPVTICVRHLGQSIPSSKGRFLLVLASCSREHFSLPNRTDVILHPRIKVQRPSVSSMGMFRQLTRLPCKVPCLGALLSVVPHDVHQQAQDNHWNQRQRQVEHHPPRDRRLAF